MKMSSKDILVGVSVFVFSLAPMLIFYYADRERNDLFYQWLNQADENCVKRAKEDARETEWCNEIRQSINSSEILSKDNNLTLLLIWISPLLAGLLWSNYDLRKKIEALEKK